MFSVLRTIFLSELAREFIGKRSRSRGSSNLTRRKKAPSPGVKGIAGWILDHLPEVAGTLAFLYLWSQLGSFFGALAVSVLFAVALTAGWLFYKQKKTGMSPAESLRLQRKIRKTKSQWPKALDYINAKNPNIPLNSLKADNKGDLSAVVHAGQNGMTSASFVKASSDIAEIIGCREVDVLPLGYSGTIKIKFSWSDPLGKTVKPTAITNAPKGHAPVAVDDSHNVYSIPILNSKGETIMTPLFVGGVSGSGKSGFLWSFLAGALVQEIPMRLHVLDPAGGTELAALGEAYFKNGGKPIVVKKTRARKTAASATSLAKETDPNLETVIDSIEADAPGARSFITIGSYSNKASDADAMIKAMTEEMTARMEKMAGKSRLHKPTLEEPLNILVIDEFLRLSPELKKADSPLAELMSLGRKAGFSVIALSQIGHADAIGRVRELFPRRLVFATSTREQTVAVLGSNDLADRAPAHKISETTPGIFYGVSETDRNMVKGRTVYYDDRAVYQIAEGHIPYGLENFGMAPTPDPSAPGAVPHFVYRLFNSAGELLYVGLTKDIEQRFGQHARTQPWWHEVSINDTRITNHPDEESARAEETKEIKTLYPTYNKSQNQKNPFRRLSPRTKSPGVPNFADAKPESKSLRERIFS